MFSKAERFKETGKYKLTQTCVRALVVASMCLVRPRLFLFLFPWLVSTVPPVGSYDVGAGNTSFGATSFQRAARFKTEGTGTTKARRVCHASEKYLLLFFLLFTDGDASFSEDSLLVAATPVGLWLLSVNQLFVN